MTLRSIQYGYCYENGKIVEYPTEAKIVRKIFALYTQGKSLRELVVYLDEHEVEYMPGISTWNKARVMRILQNKSYLGNAKYVQIIEKDIFEMAQLLKQSKNNQGETDRKAMSYQLHGVVVCAECGAVMRHRSDVRSKKIDRWTCANPDCKKIIAKKTDVLLNEITELLNLIIKYLQVLIMPVLEDNELSPELLGISNEINIDLTREQIDEDGLKVRILEYASNIYESTNLTRCLTQRLQDYFTNTPILPCFNKQIFDEVVDKIKLYPNGTVGIILINGQEILKESFNGTTTKDS